MPLHHSKMIANADTRTSSKRQVGVARKTLFILWCEALRVKLFRLREVVWATMQCIGANHHVPVLRDKVAIYVNSVQCCPRYPVGRRVETHCFLEYLECVR